MKLGNNIKKFRNLKKMTQDELADLLGTTSKSISRWEQDITYPDITMLPIIANVFNITVDELLGVEKIKQEEYIKELTYKANEFQKNNDVKSEVLLWEKAYKEFPNNEEIICNLISSMVSFNIINNKLHYTKEIEKLSNNILDKCTNNNIRLIITKELVNYYSQMGNKQMAEYYCKQLPNNLLQTYNVMRTRYLKNDDLIKSIQINISDLVNEILREVELVMNDQKEVYSNEYKKEIIERLVNIQKLVFENENDYGYNSVSILFNIIGLIKLEIKTTNVKDKVLDYMMEVKNIIKYIKDFKPHIMKSPFMNKLNCEHIGCNSHVLLDLKNNILNEMNSNEFCEYKNNLEYLEIIDLVNNLFHDY